MSAARVLKSCMVSECKSSHFFKPAFGAARPAPRLFVLESLHSTAWTTFLGFQLQGWREALRQLVADFTSQNVYPDIILVYAGGSPRRHSFFNNSHNPIRILRPYLNQHFE